ncbi:thyrotropin receptor-like [Anneissia japonica]|uniref:thyrotropin receptor-like n=1 Tax=Anneissia japonica TaxID=1529436 RepID=UPI0014256A07|nr:thyrotropin receptor-like [Anneissia japonica]
MTIGRTGITTVPNLTMIEPKAGLLQRVSLTHNKIEHLYESMFYGMNFLIYKLELEHNQITRIPAYTFEGLTVKDLDLSNNPIEGLVEDSFAGIDEDELDLINLSNTKIEMLPTKGLKKIKSLNIEDTPRLMQFPSVFVFEEIENAQLHYFSHCCAFTYETERNAPDSSKYNKTDEVKGCTTTAEPPYWPTTNNERTRAKTSPWIRGTTTMEPFDPLNHFDPSGRISSDAVPLVQTGHGVVMRRRSIGSSTHIPVNFPSDPIDGDRSASHALSSLVFSSNDSIVGQPNSLSGSSGSLGFDITPINPNTTHNHIGSKCNELAKKNYSLVTCTPVPNAFNPCSDVMGYIFLRVLVWGVALTALIGNLVVVMVLLSNRNKMSVPKFLMTNLAFADFCMGLYLLMIASVDAHTIGEYYNYAINWQFGAGCRIAGFFSLFSSELSVFTLSVMTIERWYTIIYAINLNKRIRLHHASRIMIAGWLFAILMASFPLFGVSSYGTTSICLPYDNGTIPSIVYLTLLLTMNGIAFVLICVCYIMMYMTVHSPNTITHRKDMKVAKRMAVLVFTDFACWAPIAFFGMTALFGKPLLTTDESKILIVLFYPINSCANPFLYAIFTKTFRRDCILLLARHGLCERKALKYKATISGFRSMSQSATMREQFGKQWHRDSAGSVLTQHTSTNDNRPSVAFSERDFALDSPKPTPRATPVTSPVVPVKEFTEANKPAKSNLYSKHSEVSRKLSSVPEKAVDDKNSPDTDKNSQGRDCRPNGIIENVKLKSDERSEDIQSNVNNNYENVEVETHRENEHMYDEIKEDDIEEAPGATEVPKIMVVCNIEDRETVL